ncbi:MAG: SemiSWEET transporter [Solidesulfovibrio sp.]|uniref:SemiSWEET family sugar transporter n=1 Tax=Solidesulfovibrio sp. TaxID=2910990 RepID=UPI002B20BC14|nr:SemiSWEET transporter [Solidesulfovibrio sp.]MEA4857834.1 SemiSWEET transporter [Solidesulfovibrio sp.]
MTTLSDIVGYAAGLLTTAAFAPQVLQVVRTRSTKDISLGMYVIISVGISLWLVHGLQVGSMPVVAANAVTLVLVLVILAMKLRYK